MVLGGANSILAAPRNRDGSTPRNNGTDESYHYKLQLEVVVTFSTEISVKKLDASASSVSESCKR